MNTSTGDNARVLPDGVEPLAGVSFLKSWWPVLAVGAGLVVIAACLLAPQLEQNREVRVELLKLRAENVRVEAQIAANYAFLAKLATGDDPTLTARLAHRQLRLLPDGTEALELQGIAEEPRSPFQLVRVAAAVEAGEANMGWGGKVRLPGFLGDGRTRLYLLAGALMLVGVGLVCDGKRRQMSDL